MAEISYSLSKENVHIHDSYKIRNRETMHTTLENIRREAALQGYQYHRSNQSWVIEWRAHNYLYDKGIQQARTAEVDLNENEPLWRRACYCILSLLYHA